MTLYPIFPWIGGKRVVRTKIIKYFPDPSEYDTYIEPFLGAGSLLLILAPSHALVNDLNPWVIMLWHLCSHHPEYVIKQFRKYTNNWKTDVSNYHALLDHFNRNHTKYTNDVPISFQSNSKSCNCRPQLLHLAFAFFVLVKCSYGAKVFFDKNNVVKCHYGKKPFSSLVNDNYLEVHSYLANNRIIFHVGDYLKVFSKIRGEALIYMDPPYQATDLKNNVGKYHATKHFLDDDHVILKNTVDKLCKKHFIVQSNSCTPYVRKLYKEYRIVPLKVSRPLASMMKNRDENITSPNECLILNF